MMKSILDYMIHGDVPSSRAVFNTRPEIRIFEVYSYTTSIPPCSPHQ